MCVCVCARAYVCVSLPQSVVTRVFFRESVLQEGFTLERDRGKESRGKDGGGF